MFDEIIHCPSVIQRQRRLVIGSGEQLRLLLVEFRGGDHAAVSQLGELGEFVGSATGSRCVLHEICVDDVVGEVIEITERSVVLRQRDGARVHIPNVNVLSKKVVVYSTETDRRSVVELKLAAGTDIEHADQVIRTALGDVAEITRIGSVRATSLDTCVGLSIGFWHQSSLGAQPRAIDAAIRSLQRAFESAGIRFASVIEVQIVDSELTIDHAPDRADAAE